MSYPGNNTVANIAALARMSLNDGQFAYVATVKDPWQYVASGAQFTIDGITVVATAKGGNTRWVRSLSCNPAWRFGIDDWYIDPTAGNDENAGTIGAPIKTGAELARRWGSQNQVKQSGVSPNFGVNIHILGDIVAPDFLQIDCRVDNSTEIFVVGTPTVITTSVAGATAVTAENQATNTPWSLTDAVTAAAISVGDRIRWTAGPAAGACGFAAKNLGASAWRFSQPQLSQLASFNATPVAKSPAANQAYVVERLTHIELGYVNVTQQSIDSSFVTFVGFSDLLISANSIIIPTLNGGKDNVLSLQIIYNQCQIAAENAVCSGLYFSNTAFLNGAIFRDEDFVSGGFFTGAQLVQWQCSSEGTIDNDPLIQSTHGVLCSNNCVLGNLGIFDTTAPGGGLTGDGLSVGIAANGQGTSSNAGISINGQIWGAGNAGAGLHVRSGSVAVLAVGVTTPNVTGTLGDFELGTTGNERSFVNATGLYSAIIAPTWANFVDAAQFAHNAHNVAQDAHLTTLG